jgi:hypothetical protein
MMRSELFSRVSVCSVLLGFQVSLAACGGDPVAAPLPTTAGTGPSTAGAAAAGGAQTAGIGTIPSGVGAAGSAVGGGVAGAGTAGAAGMAAMMGAAGAPAFMPGSPTFGAIYQEIIVGTGCNGGPTCHASTVAGQLKMTTKPDAYTALVGAKAMGMNLVMNGSPNCKDSALTRVVAGDPNASLLFKKISSDTPECGGKMPPSGALPTDKVEQIRAWIMNGAKND